MAFMEDGKGWHLLQGHHGISSRGQHETHDGFECLLQVQDDKSPNQCIQIFSIRAIKLRGEFSHWSDGNSLDRKIAECRKSMSPPLPLPLPASCDDSTKHHHQRNTPPPHHHFQAKVSDSMRCGARLCHQWTRHSLNSSKLKVAYLPPHFSYKTCPECRHPLPSPRHKVTSPLNGEIVVGRRFSPSPVKFHCLYQSPLMKLVPATDL